MKKAELLAPVGKMENAIAAIENGADALFVGGKGFNARQAAENFTADELVEIVNYAKLRGVRVYVTVNILVKEKEISELFGYLKYLEEVGVHAIIIQDLGVAELVRKHFPNLRMHASTQMSAHSIEDVRFLKELGFKRVVLAREMQLEEIKEIVSNCDIEIETFVHGALCYSYSGQCLMSSLIGGRSGNRGRCAQPCRMKYSLKEDGISVTKEEYLLSLKDICSVEFLPELLECGIHSFKIEGRMKSPEYVASVVGTYRKYLDAAESGQSQKVTEEDMDVLKGIFNRGGFSKGYYYERGSRRMLTSNSPRHIGLRAGVVTHYSPKTGIATIKVERTLNPGDGLEVIRQGKESVGTGITRLCEAGSLIKCQFDKYVENGSEVYLTKNHKLLKQMKQTYQRPMRKLPIDIEIIGKIGEPVWMSASYKDKKVVCEGAILEEASQNPVIKEQAIRQLTKLGASSFKANEVKIEWPEQAYLGIGDLNAIRRDLVSKLEEKLLTVTSVSHESSYVKETMSSHGEKIYIARVMTLEQLKVCLRFKEIKAIYWEWQYNKELTSEAIEMCQSNRVVFYLVLPAIMKETGYRQYEEELKTWAKNEHINGFVIRNMGEYQWLKAYNKAIVIDYNMNIMNSEAIRLWTEHGVERITISPELTLDELSELQGDKEKIIYGKLPMMTSSQCVLRNTAHCQKGTKVHHVFEMEDRKKTPWRIQTDCKACIMQILSYAPIVTKKVDTLYLKNNFSLRLQFTDENSEETLDVLKAYFETGYLPKGAEFKTVL